LTAFTPTATASTAWRAWRFPPPHEGAFGELRATALAAGALAAGEKLVWIQREETALCAPVPVSTQIVTA
jgi:hypothetical protein